ncbi:hypothetical protein [Spirosoma sp. KNUC1025]|uniref:hypothetical protein n=1 Tax=Spirosoma sp. KNUC1025 TaxID=2894082 RepID=UPI003862D8AB|nr:hypothetical protein LN737_10370 [Spirosoma sp. KNUC1025]
MGSPVSVDPTDAVTSVVIPFQVVDNAGKTSPNTATVTLPLSTPLTLSGTVFNDADGGTIDGTATNVIAGNTFYVSIMDPTTGNVISTTAVASDGTYSLPVNPNTSYQVVLSTAPQTVGSPVSATLLTGAAHTAEGTAPTGDGTPDGQTGVSVVTTSVTGVNFGIDPLPTPGSGSATVANASVVSAVTVPPTAFTSTSPSTDTAPGSVTAIHVTSFPTNVTSLTINGTVYTSLPVGGIVVPTNSSGAPTVPILMDPTNDANPVVFTFTAIDNAGKESTTTGTATLNFTGVPDLTPIIYARPSTTYNTTTISVVVDVFELKNVSTSGLITVKVNKDPKISLSFTGSATSVGGRSVSNSAWSFDGTLDDDYYVLTTTQVIAGGNVLSFGLNGTLTPGATSGTLTLTTVIDGGSGGEMKINNNTDADKIDFFQQ